MNVMVNMAGFHAGSTSMGPGASARGTIAALGPQGITVKLEGTIGDVEVVTVEPERLTMVP